MFPERKNDKCPLLQQNRSQRWVMMCKTTVWMASAVFIRNPGACINNWSLLKWHSAILGEIKTCNSIVEYVLKGMVEILTHKNLSSSMATHVHIIVDSESNFSAPSATTLNRRWPRENVQGLCIFFLSSSLCWKHKQQSTFHNPGVKSYPSKMEKVKPRSKIRGYSEVCAIFIKWNKGLA